METFLLGVSTLRSTFLQSQRTFPVLFTPNVNKVVSKIFRSAVGKNDNVIRTKTKKAQGSGNRNAKQAPGKHYALKTNHGEYVKKYDTLCTQPRLRYHGGLNVGTCGRFTLVALAEGKVVITCEKPDLDFSHSWSKLFYAGKEGVTFYKKYVNVIPRELPYRFKIIDRI